MNGMNPLKYVGAATMALLMLPSLANAAVEIGPGELFATATVEGSYDSNIFSNNKEIDDYILKAKPGLEWKSKDTKLESVLKAGYNIQRFDQNSDEDAEDWETSAKFSYDNEKTKVSLDTSYKRVSSANEAVNTRTESENFDLTLKGTLRYSSKFSLGSELKANDQHYLKGGSDVRYYSGQGRFIYHYSEKTDVFAGARYRTTETKIKSAESDDYAYFVGAENQLLPKVTGSVRVGWQERDYDKSNNDNSGLNMNIDLSYKYSDKTSINLKAAKDFSTTAGQQTSDKTSAGISVRNKYDEKITLTAGFDYSFTEQETVAANGVVTPGKEDTAYTVKAGATYKLSDMWSLKFDASRRINDSTVISSEYDRDQLSLAITGRY